MTVQLPYSVQSFTQQKQDQFKLAVAAAAGLEDFRVTINSISEAVSIVVDFSVRVPAAAKNNPEPIRAALTMENVNTNLASQGVAAIDTVVTPAHITSPSMAYYTFDSSANVTCPQGIYYDSGSDLNGIDGGDNYGGLFSGDSNSYDGKVESVESDKSYFDAHGAKSYFEDWGMFVKDDPDYAYYFGYDTDYAYNPNWYGPEDFAPDLCGCMPITGVSSGTVSVYPPNIATFADCRWVISSEPGNMISLNITSFEKTSDGDAMLIIRRCESEVCREPVQIARIDLQLGTSESKLFPQWTSNNIMNNFPPLTSSTGYLGLFLYTGLGSFPEPTQGFTAEWRISEPAEVEKGVTCPAEGLRYANSDFDGYDIYGIFGERAWQKELDFYSENGFYYWGYDYDTGYDAPNNCGCEALAASHGTIAVHPPNIATQIPSDCRWVISAPPGNTITLNVTFTTTLNEEGSLGPSQWEYVRIFRCATVDCEYPVKLGAITGTIGSQTFKSSSGFMQVFLTTAHGHEWGASDGLEASWTIEQCDTCLKSCQEGERKVYKYAPCTRCGDGKVEGGEVCDDGNFDWDDGCSGLCTVEDGYTCDDMSPSACTAATPQVAMP